MTPHCLLSTISSNWHLLKLDQNINSTSLRSCLNMHVPLICYLSAPFFSSCSISTWRNPTQLSGHISNLTLLLTPFLTSQIECDFSNLFFLQHLPWPALCYFIFYIYPSSDLMRVFNTVPRTLSKY